jgi:hypothetical protein
MVKAYWRRAARVALQDTLRALSLDSFERAALRMGAAIVGAVIVWWGTQGGTTSDLILRAITTAAVLGLLPGVYLSKLAVAPAKMDKEVHNTIADLTRQLDDRENRQKVRAALWALREEGVEIRNDGLTTRVINSWNEKFEQWHARVLEQAGALSMDLRHSLDPIDKISPESNERVAVDSASHQKNVSVMSEILSRLYKHLDRTS